MDDTALVGVVVGHSVKLVCDFLPRPVSGGGFRSSQTPPAPVLIKKAAGIDTASGVPNKNKVGSITLAQAEEIAKTKMPDLNAASLEAAVSMIKGTARSMGVTVEG